MTFLALFPATRWDDDMTPEGIAAQLDKMREEVDETERAVVFGESDERVLEEACDAMVAASSLVRRYALRLGTTPEAALAMVASKNAGRGYLAP